MAHFQYSRRELISKGASGLVYLACGTTLFAKEPSLENLAKEWNMPLSRVEQIAKECRQPVEKTLEGTGVIYVTRDQTGRDLDWRNGSDLEKIQANREREIYQRHLSPEQRKPVLELFYVNNNIAAKEGLDPDKHLAAVYRNVCVEMGDKLSFLAFRQGERGVKQSEFLNLKRIINLNYSLCILIYEHQRGNIIRHKENIEPGFVGIKNWKNWNDLILKYLTENILV